MYRISNQYIYFFLLHNGPKIRWRWWRHFHSTQLLAFLIVVRQSKWQFWNPRTKLDSKGMFWKENFEFRNLTFFDLNMTWPRVRYENLCHHRILRPKQSIKHVSHDTRAMFSYGGLTWPDLDLNLCLLSISVLLTWHLRHPFSSTLAVFGLAAVSDLVPAAHKAMQVSFDLTFDLTFTRYLTLIKIKIALDSSRWELSIAA